MAYLKTVGCDCPECPPDPCDPGCECTLFYEESVSGDFSDAIDVTGQFLVAQDIQITINPDVLSSGRLIVTAGAASWDSGCVPGGAPSSTVITVPGGTTTITVDLTYGCAPGTNVNPVVIAVECVGFP